MQFGNLVSGDHATSAAIDTHMSAAHLSKTVNQVLEILNVAALIGTNRDSLHILLNSGVHQLINGAIMTQVDHLGSLRLQNATHDVDRHVMAIEQAGSSDKSNWVCRYVQFLSRHPQPISVAVSTGPQTSCRPRSISLRAPALNDPLPTAFHLIQVPAASFVPFAASVGLDTPGLSNRYERPLCVRLQ